jgi:hypothetical protein
MIDFYNIQFYNQGSTKYDSYQELFTQSTGVFSGTSVKEIMNRGIPREKIIVGKPATPGDVMNTGYVDSAQLGQWAAQAKNEFGWWSGFMIWQFKGDLVGQIINNAASNLI